MKKSKLLSLFLALILLLSGILPSISNSVYASNFDSSTSEETQELDKEIEELNENKENFEKNEEESALSKEDLQPKDLKLDLSHENYGNKEDIQVRAYEDTQNFSSEIRFANPSKTAFYGGENINLYNYVSLSGNTTILDEGSYTLIYLSKEYFSKPKETDVNTIFDTFKSLSIDETETDYVIKISYTKLAGGYNAATPFNVRFIPRQTINDSEIAIKQEFYNVNDEILSESFLKVQGKAQIETPRNYVYSTLNIIEKVDENFIVNAKTEYIFDTYTISTPTYDYNDPRDRRISIKIPEGLTLVDSDNKWTYDSKTQTYYKDIKRDNLRYSELRVTLDLGGLDLKGYDSSSKAKEIKIDYTLSVVENGVVKDDIKPVNWITKRRFYALKKKPQPPAGAYGYINTRRTQKIINKEYKTLDESGYVYLPYDDSLLSNFRMKFFYDAINSYSFTNFNNQDDPKLVITTTKSDVTPYTYPSEIRLNLQTKNLTEDEIADFTSKVKGTKAYGIKYDGSKVLLTESVPIAYNDEGEYFKFKGSEYKTIEFVYPNGGVLYENKAQIEKYKRVLGTDVISDFREEIIPDLKKKLEKSEFPNIGPNQNVSGLSSYYDISRTDYKLTYLQYATDSEPKTFEKSITANTYTYKRLDYNEIRGKNYITISNGSFFYVGDTVKTYLSYMHTKNGNSFPSVEPENANLYYLVPDGLEPIENPEYFSQMRMIRGYKEGYNLVIAKPAKTEIPTVGNVAVSYKQNDYRLEFKVTDRLDIGSYNIYAAFAIDNNKVEVIDQIQYGILQTDTPYGLWEDITTSVDNRSEIPSKYTSLRSTSFTVYPPLVLSAYKQVKLRTEADSKYASALGTRAKIGDEIDYRWYFKNNSPKAVHSLEIIDVLPYKGDKSIVENQVGEYPSRQSRFKTPLQSVEPNEKFDFYYSTDTVKDTLEENVQANWQSSVDDFSKVTMIKAVLKPGQKIEVDEICSIVTHNQIEDNSTIEDGEKAFNSFAYSLNDGNTFTEALKVEVAVHYPKKDILIKKVDLNDQNVSLPNTVFDLYSENDELLESDLTTNRHGELLLRDLFVGRTYYLLEKSAPFPYAVDSEKVLFTVLGGEEEQIITVENDVKRIDIPVTKVWEDDNKDNDRPESIKVKLFANGIETDKELILNESNNWTSSFNGLEEFNEDDETNINYTVVEVGAEGNFILLNGNRYRVKIEGSMNEGFTITNIKQIPWIPLTPPNINVKVEKEWLDSDGKVIDAPIDSIEVELYKDGQATGMKESLNADNNWKATFNNLPYSTELGGNPINYTVMEVGAEDNQIKISENWFNVTITGSMRDGFKITNQMKEIPEKPIDPVKPNNPTTGDDFSNIYVYMIILSAIGLAYIFRMKNINKK